MPTTAPSRPRRADAERNRSRILAAASELFAERGLDASMPELAERAGVGVGTLYRAFPDKDHLLGRGDGRAPALARRRDRGRDRGAPTRGRPSPTSSGRAPPCTSRTAPFTSACARALELPEVREARGRTLDGFQRLIERAQAAGAMRADVVAEDIPMLMAGVGLSRVAGPGRGVGAPSGGRHRRPARRGRSPAAQQAAQPRPARRHRARAALPALAGALSTVLLDRVREVVGALARRAQREADDELAHEVGGLEHVVEGQLRCRSPAGARS